MRQSLDGMSASKSAEFVKDRRRFEGRRPASSGWRRGVRRSLFARGSAQKGVEFGYLPPM
jgi:hypothetical protein